MSKATVFISYSHKDEDWKDRLVTHLGVLQKQGLLDIWDDSRIGGGEEWRKEIQKAMDAASAAVLLVSANFLTSKFILDEEVPRFLERRHNEGLPVFPVIVKSCAWKKVTWLTQMQVRPKNARPLSKHGGDRRDEALASIAEEILGLFELARAPTEPKGAPLPRVKISIAKLPSTGPHLFGREKELKLLDDAWADHSTKVLSLVAWGGVGKSALVNHWLRSLERDRYRGAERVFGWSFYSQGTTDRVVSADQFIDAALRWFGDPKPTEGSPWDKGVRLADLARAQRTLLLLDGLEPLQYPPGPQEGRLKDQALQALVRELPAHNSGLCVISSRLPVTDLEDFEGSTARRIDLEQLSPQAGAQVLKAQGVKGDDPELERASSEFGGHALALTLLGSYLRDVYGGDVRRRREVGPLEEELRQGGHARRVMASYEKWFGEGPDLAVLRILGLFDRPADGLAVAALRAKPGIPGLTDTLQNLSEREWRQVLAKLRHSRLVAEPDPSQPETLDAHPLVREHFGQQLRQNCPAAWREGHNRLYEHLKRTTKQLPDTIEEMAPLFAAVAHGCQAGRHQEALDEVYRQRIMRGNQFFSTHKLGTFGAELAVLSGFFDPPWRKPVSGLREADKGFVLSEAGFDLRALGRLEEAAQPMQASLAAHIGFQDWKNAAAAASNLSELYLSMGDLTQALAYAQKSVDLADRSGDPFQRLTKRARLADTLHQGGRISDAEAAFREAEEMQKAKQPEFPLLGSVQGFLYCDLLLTKREYGEVQIRATQTLEWAKAEGFLLDIALDHLSLGMAHLLQAHQEGRNEFTQARSHLEGAVDGFRRAGAQEFIARGLLARAELHQVTGALKPARADIHEAMAIATRGGMRLFQADCHLVYARLYLAQGKKDEARESLATAKKMIEEMGYHRRDKDVDEIAQQLA